RFSAGQIEPFIYCGARAAGDQGHFLRVITVKKPQDQHAGYLGGFLSAACVSAHPAELVLGCELVAKINGRKSYFGRIVLDNGKLNKPVPVCPALLGYVQIAKRDIKITVEILDPVGIRAV